MTPNHTMPVHDARETALPAPKRRRMRRDWVRGVARLACVLLAIVGTLPFVATLVVRSDWARSWARDQTERALRDQGIVASYEVALRVWPLAVELTNVRVQSSDGGPPALECRRARVQPKVFALLAGKVAIDQIELDGPRVRAVVRDGEIANLALKKGEKSEGPVHAPFSTFAVTDARVDLEVDGTRFDAQSVDVDVTTEDDPAEGSSFEVATRVGQASVHRARAIVGGGGRAIDDDALCSIEGRIRVEPHAILVRRLDGVGSADLDAAADSTPSCDLPATDKRRVELSIGHARVTFPKDPEKKIPAVDGHVHVRAPIALAERAVSLPETDGWIAAEADVRYAEDTQIPDVSGALEAHDLRLAQFGFAQEVTSKIEIRRNVVHSPTTTVRLAGGTVTLTDTVIDPLASGIRLEKTRADVAGVDFTALLRSLGIHPHPWVAWDLREAHMPVFAGTFVPLRLDGDFNGKTYSFGVFDRPAEDRDRQRVFGIADAQVAGRLSVRPDGVKFVDARVTMPRSHAEGVLVSLGFKNDLRVEAPKVVADLEDVTPVGPVPLHGKVEASAHVGGTFLKPEPEGDVRSASGLVVASLSFGDLSAGHFKVDVTKPELEITNVHAKKRDSAYEVPTARLVFGSPAEGFEVDALGTTGGFGLRDLLSMFALDDDPRFDQLDATIAARADIHVAIGGPEDACGGGYTAIDARGHLDHIFAYGERYAQGDADVSLRWYDSRRGIAGADVDVKSFVVEKVPPPTGTRAGASGSIVGSASIRRGGALSANLVAQGVQLSHVDTLGKLAQQVEGSISGVAHVTGNLDDFLPDAGIVTRAEIDVVGTRVRGVALPNSHLDVSVTQRLAQQKRVMGRTRCGSPIPAAFDKQAYLADGSSHGEWTINGDLLGSTVHLADVVMTRAKSPHLSGRASIRGLDLGALARMKAPAGADADQTAGEPSATPIGGQLWGELVLDDVPLDAPAKTRGTLLLGPTVVSRAGQKLSLKPPREPVRIENDTVRMPPLEVALDTPEGFRGGFVLEGSVSHVTSDPTLAFDARLDPVDLAVLSRVVPKVERAAGRVEGGFTITGKASAPAIDGTLHAVADEIKLRGYADAISDARVEVRATATELAAAGTGKFASGTLAFEATLPIKGFELGALDARVVAKGLRMAPADGIAAAFDADLQVAYDPKARGGDAASALPRVTGDLTLASFEYTRPIMLATDLSTLGTRSRRTEVNAYDPALDVLTVDLRVRSKDASTAIAIRNNLAEVRLKIDSTALEISGTNQRFGLRGALSVISGGRFHFQANDFEVKQGIVRFDDPTRINPNVDVTATTDYRRYSDTSAAGAGTTGVPAAAAAGGAAGTQVWHITLHAYSDPEHPDDLRVDLTSDPGGLSYEDIVLLLTVGMRRVELDALQASSLGSSVALNFLGAASGADRAVKKVVPIIDDFRFGSAYSPVTGKTEPQLTVGKVLTKDLRATVTTGLGEDRELRSNIEMRLNNRLSVQGSYDNLTQSGSPVGNAGVDLRWRLDFE